MDVRTALERSECLFDRATVERAIDQMAIRITLALHDAWPIVVCVMNGALVVTADLLERLHFPLELDYLHVTRYADSTRGGELEWHSAPRVPMTGRTVLLVDDIIDEGKTLAAAVERLEAMGAGSVRTAVLLQKAIARRAAITPDFVGLTCPDRYVFGRGMDYRGHWRNLAEIRALPAQQADDRGGERT
jgi:hypoxanthine phosphoribosyltransferase